MSWDSFNILKNHQIMSEYVYPGAGLLDKLQQIYQNISNVQFKNKLLIGTTQPEIDIISNDNDDKNHIIWSFGDQIIMEFDNIRTHDIKIDDKNSKLDNFPLFDKIISEDLTLSDKLIDINIDDFYNLQASNGLEYKNCFKSLIKLAYNDKYSYGTLKIDSNIIDDFNIHPAILDGALQTVLVYFNSACIPKSVKSYQYFDQNDQLNDTYYSVVERLDLYKFNVYLYNDNKLLAFVNELELAPIKEYKIKYNLIHSYKYYLSNSLYSNNYFSGDFFYDINIDHNFTPKNNIINNLALEYIKKLDLNNLNITTKYFESVINRYTNYIHNDIYNYTDNYPYQQHEFNLISNTGSKLKDILETKINPVDLIFNKSKDDAFKLYSESESSIYYNTLIANIVKSIPNNKPLRILEIGAGTGGTTTYLLPILQHFNYVQYYFTDISHSFLNDAKIKFANYDFVHFDILNIENDLTLSENQFDIIIASNVLHATENITKTIQNVNKLLLNNGLLILYELNKGSPFIDITFGLTDGWWRFYGKDNLRNDYPLLSLDEWENLLLHNNYYNFKSYGDEYQSVIISNKNNISSISQNSNMSNHNFNIIYLYDNSIEDVLNKLNNNNDDNLYIITKNIYNIKDFDFDYKFSWIIGTIKSFINENKDRNIKHLDIDNDQFLFDILNDEQNKNDKIIIYRNGYRFNVTTKEENTLGFLQTKLKGNNGLDSIEITPQMNIASHNFLIKYSALNFHDYLSVINGIDEKLDLMTKKRIIGAEAIGTFIDGDLKDKTYISLKPNCFCSYTSIKKNDLLLDIPHNLKLEEIISMPIAYLTTYHALIKIAKLKPNSRVLINNASVAVGHAAINICKDYNCIIYATSRKQEKRDYLKSLKIDHIIDSSNASYYKNLNVKYDIILNSLIDDHITLGFDYMNDNGSFIELGKQQIYTQEDINKKYNFNYHYIDLVNIVYNNPSYIKEIWGEILEKINLEIYKPIPTTTFKLKKLKDAFKYLGTAKHIGKVIIKHTNIFENDYIITGGTNGLGLLTAKYMLERNANKIYLLSRNCIIKENEKEIFEKIKEKVEIIRCDISKKEELSYFINNINNKNIRGIIHSAGVLDDGIIKNQTVEKYNNVFNPKVEGINNIDEICKNLNLNFMIVYSSTSAYYGTEGQANHSSANNYLSKYIENRNRNGLNGLSIEWGAWKEIGYVKNNKTYIENKNISMLSNTEGLSILDGLFEKNGVYIGTKLEIYDKKQELLKKQEQFKTKEEISSEIRRIIKNISNNEIKEDEPLMEAGIDSLSLVELRNSLQSSFNTKLSSDILFNYSTINKLTTYFYENYTETAKESVSNAKSPISFDKIVITSLAINLPGSDTDIDLFWNNILNGKNFSQKILGRFNFDTDFSDSYTNHGHLINDLEYFDNNFFNINEKEALLIDPQQKLALETAYTALFNNNYTKETLMDKSIGVFVGQMMYDWSHLQTDINVYSGIATSPAITSNHISYCLGLQGPSITIDTACSSSLVACNYAYKSLILGECYEALAGGVNLILDYKTYQPLCKANMLSKDGLCKTFDERADGYARGEGCAFVILKRLENAIKDNNYIWGIIEGISVNQDGMSSVITAPNGLAQQNLYLDVLKQSQIKATDIKFIATHGTGTKLGDPIEIGSITNVYGKDRTEENPLYLGAIKTNIGHTEGVAGIVNLIYSLLVMRNKTVPPIANLVNINPYIKEIIEDKQIIIPKEVYKIEDENIYTAASSYGFGGTNAHVILSSYKNEKKLEYKMPSYQKKYFDIFNITGKYYWLTDKRYIINKNHICDHIVNDNVIFPGAGYIDLALFSSKNNTLTQIQFINTLKIDSDKEVDIQINSDNKQILISHSDSDYFKCSFSESDKSDIDFIIPKKEDTEKINIDLFYKLIEQNGISYGQSFRPIQNIELNKTNNQCWAKLSSDLVIKTTVLLDGAFQTVASLIDETNTFVPFSIEKITLFDKLGSNINVYAILTDSDYEKCTYSADIILYDSDHRIVGHIKNFTVKKILMPNNYAGRSFNWSQIDSIKINDQISYDYVYTNKEEEFFTTFINLNLTQYKSILFVDLNIRSGLIGFVKSFKLEYPNIRSKYIYVENNDELELEKYLSDDFVKYENNQRYVGKISDTNYSFADNRKLYFNERGALSNLKLVSTSRKELLDNQIEVKVFASGLNFRDVLNVMNLYPGNPGPIGGEFSGIVSKTNNKEFKIGDKVFGIATECITDYIITIPDLIIKTESNNFSYLASLPIVALTVEHAFCNLSNLIPNMNVLIHAGAGGVGLIATQYALNAGCNVYVTCSDNKKIHIDSRVKKITSSRDADIFLQDFSNIEFDIVLNSLSDNFIKYSFDLLKNNGIFIEIGKRNIWTVTKANNYKPVKYYCVAIDHMIKTEPEKIKEMLENINRRNLKQINIKEYLIEESIDAFRYLQSGNNVGKVIITNHKALEGNYIITGGTGALGQITARWLLSSGVDKVYLISRSGKQVDSDIADRCEIINMDLKLETNVKELFSKIPNIKGIIHSAGVLRDGLFQKQTEETYSEVYESKALIAKHLDKYSADLDLDNFICYSSVSSMMGNIGQTNYSTANAYLDNLILDRNNRGLCGLSIQWSAWEILSGGMVNSDVLNNLKQMGLIPITEQMGEGFLNNIINKKGIHSCMPVIKKEDNKPNSDIQTKFKTKEEIHSEIKRIVQNISNNEIKDDDSLMDAGIDSLSSVELRNSLQSSFNIVLDNSLLFNYPTINALTKYIISKMPKESKYKITYNNIKSNIVDNLCIELENVGKIEYMGYTDIENVDIDNDIDIQQQNVKLNTYYDKNTKINKSCVITLYNFIEPEEDKETGDIIKQNLSDQLSNINKTLLEYEPLNGRIKYFVNYL